MRQADIRAALIRLNNLYGRGDVISVNVLRGAFTRKPFQCKPETRTFRVRGRTVFALGHQMTL